MQRIPSGAAAGETAANQTFHALDAMVMPRVKQRNLTAPPAAVNGEVFIPLATATGAWVGLENRLLYYYEGVWFSHVAHRGFTAFCELEGHRIRWTGTAWVGDDVVFCARKNASQALSGATLVTWNTQVKHNANTRTISHETAISPANIVLSEAGDYEVSVDLTIEAPTTASQNRVNCWLRLATVDVPSSESSVFVDQATQPRHSVHLRFVVVASAGQILHVVCERKTGTSTINILDSSRVIVRRL